MPAPLLVRLDVARRKALLVLLEHLPLVLVADVLARLVQRLVDASERVRVVARLEADSEQAHLPAALASMTAKLVRELHMARLNRFFGARIPDLKPTAGYVQDGRRFVQEVDPLLRKLKLDEHQLIRSV